MNNDPAIDRAMELMAVRQYALPLGALQGADALCRRSGGCMEVFITAYAYYAQLIEGLACADDLYRFHPENEHCRAVKAAIERARADLPTQYFLRNPSWDAGVWWEVDREKFEAKRGLPITLTADTFWQSKVV